MKSFSLSLSDSEREKKNSNDTNERSQNSAVSLRFLQVVPTDQDVSSHMERKIFEDVRVVIPSTRRKNVRRIGIKVSVLTEVDACFFTTRSPRRSRTSRTECPTWRWRNKIFHLIRRTQELAQCPIVVFHMIVLKPSIGHRLYEETEEPEVSVEHPPDLPVLLSSFQKAVPRRTFRHECTHSIFMNLQVFRLQTASRVIRRPWKVRGVKTCS